jgi:hypothetical protein
MMTKIRTIVALGLLLMARCVSAQQGDDKPYLVKNFPMEGFTNLKVETSGGNISVQGQKSGEARIEMYVRSNQWRDQLSEEEIKKRLEDYEIRIDKDAATLTATAKRTSGNGWTNGLSISFKVYTPEKITTDLQTSGGNIKLIDLSGQQKAETSGGNIALANMKGNAEVETSGGNIDIESFSGILDAETSGGNIKLNNGQGELKMETSGGNIKMAAVAGSVEAETSGGNIGAELTSLGKYLTLSTSSGNVSVKMPMDKGMDLDLEGSKVYVTMQHFNGLVEEDKVKGKLNGGGIPVRIATSGGNVRVN